MKTGVGWMLLALLILGGGCARAQSDTGSADTGAPTQPGPKPAFTYPDATPSLDFLNGAIENSSLTLGISAGASYLDYTYSTLTSNQNRWLFHIAPSIKIQQFRPRLSWHVSYAGGWQIYTNPNNLSGSNSNLFAQNAGAGFLWQMARHWQLNATDHFTYSANPFDSFIAQPGTPTINNPNPVTYYPLTQYTMNNGVLSLTDQLTKVDSLAFTGTTSLRRTSTYNLLSVPFYNLVSYGGRASYAHKFSPRLTMGADYNYNSLDFGKGQQRSGVQTISMTVDYLIRPNMTISGWVGPEYTGVQTTILGIKLPHESFWSVSGGVNFGWQSLRNSFRAGYSRQVLDGGGYIGTSQVNSVNASYRRMLTAKLDASVGTAYFHDASTTLSSRTYNHFYIDVTASYKLAKSLSASVQYAYLWQQLSSAFIINQGNYSNNLLGFSINYTWSHPLGR
ncbi:MAG TPA: hypothetical protein VMU45_06490 [Candidatus Eisenbacteria bacterium]|nr:hypothetical protein [Candidatus Eisenbacteria bacterium]